MAKFAKLLENQAGDQLLICVKNTDNGTKETGTNGVEFTFEQESAFVSVTVSPMTYEKALEYVENFTQEKAEEILVDPFHYFTNL